MLFVGRDLSSLFVRYEANCTGGPGIFNAPSVSEARDAAHKCLLLARRELWPAGLKSAGGKVRAAGPVCAEQRLFAAAPQASEPTVTSGGHKSNQESGQSSRSCRTFHGKFPQEHSSSLDRLPSAIHLKRKQLAPFEKVSILCCDCLKSRWISAGRRMGTVYFVDYTSTVVW